MDRGADTGYALQRSTYTTSWSTAVPVWPNAAHSNSNLYVNGALVAAASLVSTSTFSNNVAAATMDSSARLFVVTGGTTATSAIYASTNPRVDVPSTPIAFYQVISLSTLETNTAATWQFTNSVYRGVTSAPSSCSISNNDFRRNLEQPEEGEQESV